MSDLKEMNSADEFSFSELIGQIRSFHSKWEELKEERDTLRLCLEEANGKISELEASITKYKAKDALIENEKYILSHVLKALQEEIAAEDNLSKKIDKIEENVDRLNVAIDNSLSDNNDGTKSSPSFTGSISDEPERDLEIDIPSSRLASIENDHQYNQPAINNGNFLIGNDLSLGVFDDVLKSSLLQETSLEKEKKQNSPEFSKLSTIQSTSISASVQSHTNTLSKGSVNLIKPAIDDCELTLPDFLSSMSNWRPGFNYEHSKLTDLFPWDLDERPSSVIATSSKFSFQSETGNEIVCTSYSPNDQNMVNSSPNGDKNGIFGSKRVESIQQEKNSSGNESQAAGAPSFNALAKLYKMKGTFSSCKFSAEFEENVKLGGNVDKKSLQNEIPLRYNLRERKLLKNRKNSSDEDLSSDSTDFNSTKDKSCGDKIICEFKKPRKLDADASSGNYLSIGGTPALNTTKSHPLIESLFTKNTQRLKTTCIICKRKNPNSQAPLFMSNLELDRHIMKNHPNPLPEYYRCPHVKENCIRHFKFKEHLRWHINMAHQSKKSNSPPENCVPEEKSQSKPCVSDFKNNVKRVHSSMVKKPSTTKIPCKLCDYVANSPKTMVIHRLKRHKIGEQENPSREPKSINNL